MIRNRGPVTMKNHRPYRVVWVFLCPILFTQAALGGLRGLFHDPEQGAQNNVKTYAPIGSFGFFYALTFSLKLRLAGYADYFMIRNRGPVTMKNHRSYRVVWVFLCANFFTQAALGGLRGLFHDPEQGARHNEKPPFLSSRLDFFMR
jgi:hypothetical protein